MRFARPVAPAGSLVFDNRLSVPQVVTVRITSGPVEVNDPMYLAGANVALDPGERRTVRSVFEKPGTYTVESWIISQNPETTRWGAETAEVDIRPVDDYAEYLHVLVDADAGLLDLRPTAVG